MNTKTVLLIILGLILVIALGWLTRDNNFGGLFSTPTPTVTNTFTPTATQPPASTFTPTMTASPTPTATATATFTPTPTVTSTATATRTLAPLWTPTKEKNNNDGGHNCPPGQIWDPILQICVGGGIP